MKLGDWSYTTAELAKLLPVFELSEEEAAFLRALKPGQGVNSLYICVCAHDAGLETLADKIVVSMKGFRGGFEVFLGIRLCDCRCHARIDLRRHWIKRILEAQEGFKNE